MLTLEELRRATLARQHLLRRSDDDPLDVTRDVLALQAQSPPSPYVALWNRVAGLDRSDVDALFVAGELVRATSLRVTLHATAADDHGWLHTAVHGELRAARLDDRRFRATGLTADDVDALVDDLLDFVDEPRSNQDVEVWLAARGIDEPRAWWALRHYGPVRHATTTMPWSFGHRPAYTGVRPPPVRGHEPDAADTALDQLVVRYLRAFGPATVADVGRFSMVPRGRVRAAVARLGDALVLRRGQGGSDLLDVPDGVLPGPDVHVPPRLLGMWDSVLLAFDDRTRVVDDATRAAVVRRNGDCLPTLLVDGTVAGVWRVVDGAVEATPFRVLDDASWNALDSEAEALLGFLPDPDDPPYRRHHRWWDRFDSSGVRRLGVR